MSYTMGFSVQTNSSAAKDKGQIPVDFRHALISGATGSGKTSSLMNPNIKDRIERGHSVIVFDHKGHEHLKVKALASSQGRLQDVIEIGKPYGVFINLVSLLDRRTFENGVMELGGGAVGHDPYWIRSAASLAVSILDILRSAYRFFSRIRSIVGFLQKYVTVKISYENKKNDLHEEEYHFPTAEPSFTSILDVCRTPLELFRFQIACREVEDRMSGMLEMTAVTLKNTAEDQTVYTEKSVLDLMLLENELRIFQRLVKMLESFEINSKDRGNSTGNNGVLQVLQNVLHGVAKADFINIAEEDLIERLERGAIVIIDTQSIDTRVYGMLLESLLKRLGNRIRGHSFRPVSVFIDEANRVLPGGEDLHADVLREAKVELIIAVQNEQQMLVRYGQFAWEAIAENLLHRYEVDDTHRVRTTDGYLFHPEPMLFDKALLKEAEIGFLDQEVSRRVLSSRFIGPPLPGRFTVEYSPYTFSEHMTIRVVDKNTGEKTEHKYVGLSGKKSILKKVLWMLEAEECPIETVE